MAIIVKQPKLILTQKEIDILKEASKIITELDERDTTGLIYEEIDNFDEGFEFIATAMKNLTIIAEVD